MAKKKYDLVIINRSFWPSYPIVGEALLQLAELVSKQHTVKILNQGDKSLKVLMRDQCRGQGVDAETFLRTSSSSTPIIRRALESIGFMLWVFFMLVKSRPKKIYVSTDPPIVVPFIVWLYTRFTSAEYIYHIQDIHPEITEVYFGKKSSFFKMLRYLDSLSLKGAKKIIVLSEEMGRTISERVKGKRDFVVIDNPAVTIDGSVNILPQQNKKGLVFCGNAGRLQRIPLLICAIDKFIELGGSLSFEFIGGGIFAPDLEKLSSKYAEVTYHGFLPTDEAAMETRKNAWAILSIEDEVTRYAFPSKTSTYAVAGLHILAICGRETSVAKWVIKEQLGTVIEPNIESLVKTFKDIESGSLKYIEPDKKEYFQKALSFEVFVNNIIDTLELGKEEGLN